MGKQIVYCNPLHKSDSEKQDATTGRMDYVFFIPPPPFYDGRRRDFDLSLENAWYGRVSLLFSMKFRTDSGEVRDVDCAMIDVLFNYAEGRCFMCTLVYSEIRKFEKYTDFNNLTSNTLIVLWCAHYLDIFEFKCTLVITDLQTNLVCLRVHVWHFDTADCA